MRIVNLHVMLVCASVIILYCFTHPVGDAYMYSHLGNNGLVFRVPDGMMYAVGNIGIVMVLQMEKNRCLNVTNNLMIKYTFDYFDHTNVTKIMAQDFNDKCLQRQSTHNTFIHTLKKIIRNDDDLQLIFKKEFIADEFSPILLKNIRHLKYYKINRSFENKYYFVDNLRYTYKFNNTILLRYFSYERDLNKYII